LGSITTGWAPYLRATQWAYRYGRKGYIPPKDTRLLICFERFLQNRTPGEVVGGGAEEDNFLLMEFS